VDRACSMCGGEQMYVYGAIMEEPEGQKPLQTPGRACGDNIKAGFMEMWLGWHGVDISGLRMGKSCGLL
jgi:hypothetical protein